MNKSAFHFHFYYGLFGLLLGISLHKIGFSDYAELHKLFTFADVRLLFTFLGAIVVAALGFACVKKENRIKINQKPFHKGNFIGGVIFGIGWVLTGACPSIVLVQLGEGKLLAFATFFGMLVGIWIFKKLKPRYFRWAMGGCDS